MKIGELSERTGIPTRMLRYYEEQGLLSSERSANGYRAYDESDVDRATRARGLVQAGLTTRLAKVVLDVEQQRAIAQPTCSRELAEMLATELAALEDRLACLTKSRDAVAEFLERTRNGDLVRGGAA
ncbi:MerR family DNA-binding transcriptional regulator [Microbacterium sp. QXD-8]|uniref:MerR family DNA-binding transcriptional regulator n=1 Tax=Microbacterium psychrotolerans TaxID=3068321 RepID=A0ABU0Z488_9MICO|nr:MerR family transcriptional regulator [Microbacterium sp. QXD-8]MDQ7879399.1 MerR family DNA-binding transcriptional regulator [Microbacterium sp. QXD-8]